MSQPPTSVFDLRPSEQLQLVEDLWDDLASTPNLVPVLDWQKEELDRRRELLKGTPASDLSWEQIVRNIRGRHGR